MKTCGEVLVELLAAHGIDTVFGIPGVHTVELYRGLPGTGIRHITPRHEQGAGFMADGYARASGRPAACFIISGPGMTNICTALGQAYADSVPVLVISSVNNTRELGLGEGRLHELPNQRNLMAGVTAFSHTLLSPDELPGVLERAFAVFNSARPRPVHIELPLDIITAQADHLRREIAGTTGRPAPSPEHIDRAARLLRQARQPVIVLGGGAQDAAVEARALVDRLGALVVTTINAKGLLEAQHPFNLGSTLPQPPILELLSEADVVLAVGSELGETETLLFNGQLSLKGKLIRIDIDPGQLCCNVPAEVPILADAGYAMSALTIALEGFTPEPVRARAQDLRRQLDALLQAPQRVHQRVMETLQQALPGVIVVGDSTQPIYSANLFYEPGQPRSYFNSSTGYGTLGYALPAAFGAKLSQPSRPVVALIGDGGIQFTISELAAAVELQLPVPILLWNNQGYGEIKRYMIERDIPCIGVDIYTPDFQTIARGFGCHAVQTESLAHLGEALAQAHRRDGPTLIEIEEQRALCW